MTLYRTYQLCYICSQGELYSNTQYIQNNTQYTCSYCFTTQNHTMNEPMDIDNSISYEGTILRQGSELYMFRCSYVKPGWYRFKFDE